MHNYVWEKNLEASEKKHLPDEWSVIHFLKKKKIYHCGIEDLNRCDYGLQNWMYKMKLSCFILLGKNLVKFIEVWFFLYV